MLHNRLDYQDIQDPQGRIGADEPVFLLRARCPIAAATVAHWADLAEQAGFGVEYVASARRWAQAMDTWNQDHGRHSPAPDPQPLRV
jgi:hypothetical protein